MTGFLELRRVAKRFGRIEVLRDLSLHVGAGEYLTVLGPSGSGKSTLLRIIAGFESPESGDVLIKGRSVLAEPAYRRGVGFVFQNFALFPHLTVFGNIAFGLANRAEGAITDKAAITRRVQDILGLVGLHGLGGREITEISGGQKQRVALARTLVADPELVLLDEPLGALDANLRERMMIELRRIHDQIGCTFIHVTGNEQEAIAMGTRMAALVRGAIPRIDDPNDVFDHPRSAAVSRLLNSSNLIVGEASGNFFHAGPITLPMPASATARTGPVSYCIRVDRIEIGPAESDAEAGVAGRFLATEYGGARVTYFFDIGTRHPLEIQHHLGNHQPADYRPDTEYRLRWRKDDAQVFDDVDGGRG